MKIKNILIHNRPAYNSEVHASRDMAVGQLNNCYEDAELADTIVAVGTNALETQTNYSLNHWVPNMRGISMEKKQAEMPDEPHAPCRVVVVDPRRTVTVNACEAELGRDGVLHLAIDSGTDLALFNALLTYIADQGWLVRLAPSTASPSTGSMTIAQRARGRCRRPRARAGRRACCGRCVAAPAADTRLYVAWFGGGLRVVAIAEPELPVEVAHFIPEPVPGQVAPQTNDVDVDERGLVHFIDRNVGLRYPRADRLNGHGHAAAAAGSRD